MDGKNADGYRRTKPIGFHEQFKDITQKFTLVSSNELNYGAYGLKRLPTPNVRNQQASHYGTGKFYA